MKDVVQEDYCFGSRVERGLENECSLVSKRGLGRQHQDLETCEKYKLLGPTPTKPTY